MITYCHHRLSNERKMSFLYFSQWKSVNLWPIWKKIARGPRISKALKLLLVPPLRRTYFWLRKELSKRRILMYLILTSLLCHSACRSKLIRMAAISCNEKRLISNMQTWNETSGANKHQFQGIDNLFTWMETVRVKKFNFTLWGINISISWKVFSWYWMPLTTVSCTYIEF